MMKKLFTFVLLGFCLHLSAQTPLTEAPDFNTYTVEDEFFSLHDMLKSGKFVAIYFYSTTCYTCQEYAPHFNKAYVTFNFNQNNVFFIAVEKYGSNSDVQLFNETHGVEVPSVSGLEGEGASIHDLFEVNITPTVILINPDKQIVEQKIDPPTAGNIVDIIEEHGGSIIGVSELTAQSVNHLLISPNPFINELNLSFSSEKEGLTSIKVFDMQSNVLCEKTIATAKGETRSQIDLSKLANGLYLILLTTPDGKHLTQKVVKQ